jgi:predicted nucleotidyltransferase
MTEKERERTLASARDALLAALPDAWAIYVYGSFARGEEWPRSDLDLAVLLPPEQDIPDVLQLIADLSARVGRDVDLADLRRVGDVLRREVLDEGHAIYVSAPDAVLGWEASAMSRYARHCEEIRGILEDFHRTGIGYRS